MSSKVAIVSDLKVVDSPQAGLGVARCLREAGISVVGIDDTEFITSNSDIFLSTHTLEEIRNLNLDGLIKKMIQFRDLYGARYIFPCYDETTILFSMIQDKLDFIGYKLFAPPIPTLKQIKKSNLGNLSVFHESIFQTPGTNRVLSIEQAKDIARGMGYPVLCKGLTKDAFLCKNENELETNIIKLSQIWNGGEIDCLIQKYISGKYRNAIVGIRRGTIVGYAEMSKVGIDSKGATWFGKIETSRMFLPLVLSLTESLDFGDCIIEIESIESEGRYWIYEINPRPPAWIYALCLAGVNLPELLIRDIISQNIRFVDREYYYGRESKEYIIPAYLIHMENIGLGSKGAAYKQSGGKYPSELI